MEKHDKGMYYMPQNTVCETASPEIEPPFRGNTTIVGARRPRVDAYERITGTAIYPSDMKLPRMIYGVIVRSPFPHAQVNEIDTDKAVKKPGVRAIITGRSPAAKGLTWQYNGQAVPFFDPHCRFEGEVVAAVAADTWYQACDAAKSIAVNYTQLPHVVDHNKSLDNDAPRMHEKQNLVGRDTYERGDIQKGFARADVILEQRFDTACQLQTPMELHGCVALWEKDRVTLWESTQGVYSVQADVAHTLGLPLSKVRIIGRYMGGGFGSKLWGGKYSVIAALLAKESARPVKLFLTREETFLCVGNRPPTSMRLKAGIKKDGTLSALEFACTGPSGAYPAGGVELVDWLIRDLYTCDHVKTISTDVYTNTGPARPFRAPGHPQGAWAMEQMMDALANAIDMDPVALRLQNIPQVSQGNGGMPYTTTGLSACIEKGAQTFGWEDAVKRAKQHNQKDHHIKRGVGMGACVWVAGGGSPPSTVVIKLFFDGSVNLNMGASDIGTGTNTVMAFVAAEELEIDPEVIQIENADTGTTQYATASGGSKTVPTESPAVRNAAIAVKQQLLEMAARDLDTPQKDLVYKGRHIISRKDPDTKIKITDISRFKQQKVIVGVGYRQANPEGKRINPFGAQFCELDINTKTGEITLLRFLGAHDSGRVINRLTYDNQVFGGIVMGIGFGLTEFRQLDHTQTGKLCNKNWHDYKLPTALDIPEEMISLPIEIDDPQANNTGTKGLGEPVTIPTAAAVANAVFMATGTQFTRTPLNPIEICRRFSRQKEA
jgi:CO/xanthine dehydrogenase Mo-binding subunit